jgi:uncharacterized membrane protein
MGKISSYPSDANVTTSDRLIGSDNENSNETKNFEVGDIINLAATIIIPQVGGSFVPYTGATGNVDLGAYTLSTSYLTSSLGMFIDGGNGAINLDGDEGLTGEFLVSQGPGATPSWTNPSSVFVPYTGATADVDLGAYDIDADAASFSVVNTDDIYSSNLFAFGVNPNIFVGNDALQPVGLLIDTSTNFFALGDIFSQFNGTKINIEDGSSRITFVGGFNLSNGEGTAGQVLTSAGAGTTPIWSSAPELATNTFWKGSFYDSITQTLAAANTATPVILRSTDLTATNGISIVTDGTNLSRITFANAGVYNILFSAQLENSALAVQTVDFWLRKNGSTAAANIPHTNGKVQLQALTNHLMAAWNYFVTVAAGDYIQLVWSATSTNISMVTEAANALHPATPSIILTANIV